jgi:DNA-binding CsgD family transcriptional regulator/tetratricopeptide (TPR) repeat protein
MVSDAAAGRGGILWVEGEPGIGKSSLLAEGMASAVSMGCRVFSGVADELGSRVGLRTLLRCFGSDGSNEVADLCGSTDADQAWPSYRATSVVERLLVFVDQQCARSPVVLVLDNLQWADELSLLAWTRLARVSAGSPLLLASACRPVAPGSRLVGLRRALQASGAEIIGLGPLATPCVDRLVEVLIGYPPGPRLRQLVAHAGGNPLYVRELVDALLRQDCLRVGDNDLAEPVTGATGMELPSSLSEMIRDRIGHMCEETMRMLRAAALLGNEFSVADLAVLTAQRATDLVAGIAEADAASVLVEVGDRLAFRHVLIRQVLYDEIPEFLRPAAHHRAAWLLAQAGMPVERVAEQLLSTSGCMPPWTVDWALGAAATLTRRAPRAAAALLNRAFECATPDSAQRGALADRLATVLYLLGRLDELRSLAAQRLSECDGGGDSGRMTWMLASALARTKHSAEAIEVADRAIRAPVADNRWTARLRALHSMQPDLDRPVRRALAEQALAEARNAGEEWAIGYARHALALAIIDHEPAAGLAVIDQALELPGDDPETVDLRIVLSTNRALALTVVGRIREAEATARGAVMLAERAGSRIGLAQTTLAENRFLAGRWDEAGAELESALGAIEEAGGYEYGLGKPLGLQALIAAHRGDWPAVRSALSRIPPDIGVRHGYPALAQAYADEHDGAAGHALAVLAENIATENPADVTIRHLWLPAAVRIAIDVGDLAVAGMATDLSAAIADRCTGPQFTATANRCRGLLDRDPGRLAAAIEFYRDSAQAGQEAETMADAALILAQQGELARARTMFADAVERCLNLGATGDIRRAEARMTPFGIRARRRSTDRRQSEGWEALTEAERRVAHLVATGLSNTDIATELVISRRTVQTHVAHILAKLGATCRAEVVVPDHR